MLLAIHFVHTLSLHPNLLHDNVDNGLLQGSGGGACVQPVPGCPVAWHHAPSCAENK